MNSSGMNTEPCILMVEDNPDDEALLLRQLEKAGLEKHIRVVRDGGKALEYLMDQQFPCDQIAALFLDLHLPKINGLQILEAIRSSDRLRELPVIVMTSSNDPEDLEKCRRLGITGFVAKPMTYTSFAKAFADTFHTQRKLPV